MWLVFTIMGQITGPLVTGTIADVYGFTTRFITVVVALVAAVVLMAALGRDTRAEARGENIPSAS